jgi:hypothetical protein
MKYIVGSLLISAAAEMRNVQKKVDKMCKKRWTNQISDHFRSVNDFIIILNQISDHFRSVNDFIIIL